MMSVDQESVEGPGDAGRGVGGDPAVEGDVPPLRDGEVHGGGGEGGQAGELPGADDGQPEALQPAGLAAERLAGPRHVARSQPLTQAPQVAVAAPGVGVKRHLVQAGRKHEGGGGHRPQPVTGQVQTLKPLQSGQSYVFCLIPVGHLRKAPGASESILQSERSSCVSWRRWEKAPG